uniref:PPM-type phosphatase domain-containing protein n=1 Tax=Ditylenchus dipsaci TaxID=166011 RepID=A0A915CT23_9BILA
MLNLVGFGTFVPPTAKRLCTVSDVIVTVSVTVIIGNPAPTRANALAAISKLWEIQKDKSRALLLENGSLQEPFPAVGCSSALKITVAAAQGGRKYMEDRVHVEVVRSSSGKLEHIYLAIYDGHGGVQASEYVRQHLHDNIKSDKLFYSEKDEDVLSAIRSGFLKTHINMQKSVDEWPMTASGYPCTAGTTASCAILRDGKLNENAIKLTEDHKPDDKEERLRIEGPVVLLEARLVFSSCLERPARTHKGPVRRSTPTENIPFLAVARALGDFWSFNPDNNEYVVSPEPDVNVCCLKSSDQFIVLASDGLTNVLPAQKTKDENFEPNHAQFLLQSTFNRWGSLRADNVSVICVKIDNELLPSGHPKNPAAMIRVTSISTQRLYTNPVRVVYQGALDRSMQPFQRIAAVNTMRSPKRSEAAYVGPGFIIPESPCRDEASSDEETENPDEQAISQFSFSYQHPKGTRRSVVEDNGPSTPPAALKSVIELNGGDTEAIGAESIGMPTSFFVEASTSSLAGSSLLSPVAMLESIRSSAAIYRSTNFMSGPRSLPNTQSFVPVMDSSANRSYLLDSVPRSVPNSQAFSPLHTADVTRSRKRKNDVEAGGDANGFGRIEPPSKRNRIWNFISGIFTKNSPKDNSL